MKVLDPVRVCIYCGKSLSKWERIRSYCWNCNELTTSEGYDDSEVVDDDNWYDLVF